MKKNPLVYFKSARVLDKKSSIQKYMQISSLTLQQFDINVSASHNKHVAPNYLVAYKQWSSVRSLTYRLTDLELKI